MRHVRAAIIAVVASILPLCALAGPKPAPAAHSKAASRTAAASRPIVAFSGSGKVTATSLHLRLAPDAHGHPLADVPHGTKLSLTAHTRQRFNEDGTGSSFWYRASFGGKTGWLWGGYLQVHVAKPPRPASQTGGRPTQWITGTAWSMLGGLNLRAAPTEKSRDIGDVKYGQKLIIDARTKERYTADGRGQFRWYEVSYSGKKGWVFGAYLRFHSPPPTTTQSTTTGNISGYPGYYKPRAERLARAAHRRGNTHPTVGKCETGVEEALRDSILNGVYLGQNSAHDFGVYAEGHRAKMLQSYGLRVDSTPGAGSSFPVGLIMIYKRGVCGFHRQWGHIQVVVDSQYACSDHCQRRGDSQCKPSLVLWPVKK